MLAAAAVAAAWPWIVESIDDWREELFKMLPFGKSLIGWYDWLDYGIAAGLDAIRNAFAGVIPGYVKNWTDALADNPVLSITLILTVLWLWRSGGTMGERINDRARIAWGLST